MKRFLSIGLLLAGLVGIATPATAHPHVFIDARVTLHLKDGKVVAITQRWQFDALFSGVVIQAFDKNKDKKFDAGEAKQVRAGAFQNLKNFNYFTTVRIAKQELKLEKVTSFAARIVDGKLAYTFTIQLPRPVDPREDKPAFLFLDKTYYVAVELAKTKPVALAGAPAKNCKPAVRDDTDNPIYFGSVVPLMVVFDCGR